MFDSLMFPNEFINVESLISGHEEGDHFRALPPVFAVVFAAE
jgi:hypothetical protein